LADRRGPVPAEGAGHGKDPSYIPAHVFAAVLVDIAARNGPAAELRQALGAWHASPGDRERWIALRDAFAAAEKEAARLQAREPVLLLDMQADRAAFSAAIAATTRLADAIKDASTALAGDPPPDPAGFAAHEETALGLCELLARLSGMVDRSLAGAGEFAARLEHPALRELAIGTLGAARGSLDDLRAELARRFDDSMARVSGWYKRRTQVATFLVALAAAVLANASAFQAARIIHDDDWLRAELVVAAAMVTREPDAAKRQELVSARVPALPIGWGNCTRVMDEASCAGVLSGSWWNLATKVFLYPLGWLVTALATMIGAPFWFDALSMLMRLRASGLVPASRESQGGAAP
ncbi:MAG: hypothetical protein ACKOUS_02260, partial [Alphaproteobacteria bacterium]